MPSQLMLPGYCEIPLYKVSGSNLYLERQVWTICGYTIVDSDNYRWLNQYRWLRSWSRGTQSYYVRRNERLLNGKRVGVMMAREVLRLPWVAGPGGDQAEHRDHQTLKNTKDNLRKATSSQNNANRIKTGVRCQFKGIRPNGLGFLAKIVYNNQCVQFQTVRTDVEAALMYNYAAYLLHGEFANLNKILEDEMPTYERQLELYEMVLKKLREVNIQV